MTRALLAFAVLGLALALLPACSPDVFDDRQCSAWYDKYFCKKAGDKCDEIATHFSVDPNNTLNTDPATKGGMCVGYQGGVVCAPVRAAAGACTAVKSCTYGRQAEDEPLSCYATCEYASGDGPGADGVCALK